MKRDCYKPYTSRLSDLAWSVDLVFKRTSLFRFALGDAFRDADSTGGADEAAQVAAHTLGAHEMGLAVIAEGYSLVSTVHTGDIASAAADALVGVEDGEDYSIAVQVVGRNKAGKPLSH